MGFTGLEEVYHARRWFETKGEEINPGKENKKISSVTFREFIGKL